MAYTTSDLDRGPAQRLLGIGVVLFSAVLFASVPNAAKIAYLEGANPQAVLTIRSVIGALLLALYLWARGQWPSMNWRNFRASAIAGLALLFTSIGFMGAVAYIDVSLAALIFYFHPFLVAVVGHFRGDLRLNLARVLLILVALAGIGLVFGMTVQTPNPVGIGLSLLGMFGALVVVLMVAEQAQRIGPVAANMLMTVWAAIYLLAVVFFAPLTGLIDAMIMPISLKGWISIVLTGVTLTLGFVLFFVGAGILGLTRAAVLSLAEPLFAILFAIVLVQEWLSPLQWFGVLLMIGSLYYFETASKETP